MEAVYLEVSAKDNLNVSNIFFEISKQIKPDACVPNAMDDIKNVDPHVVRLLDPYRSLAQSSHSRRLKRPVAPAK